jgi:hypothetical protein
VFHSTRPGLKPNPGGIEARIGYQTAQTPSCHAIVTVLSRNPLNLLTMLYLSMVDTSITVEIYARASVTQRAASTLYLLRLLVAYRL